MSAETDFRALLAAHAPLTALVGTRIAQTAVPEGSVYPLVVYTTQHDLEVALDGTVLVDATTFTAQCWGATAASARAVADAVRTACATAPVARGCTVVAEADAFDAELQRDAVALTVEWWT